MVFRNFTLKVIVHLIFIAGLSGLITYLYLNGYSGLVFVASLILIIDGIILIYSFNKANRSISYFFESIENSDSQLRFQSKSRNKSIQRLYDSMNRVNELITESKLLNQRNEQYYKALIQQSATGLIALSENNHIEIANDKACELVGILSPVNFKRLEFKNPGLWNLLCSIKPGETETFKIFRNSTYLQLLIRATGLRIFHQEIKLISIQDIKYELDVKETESWQKLISILTHEIMNSIAPITSLTTTLSRFFKNGNQAISASEVDQKIIENTIQGLEIIGERGNGLINFVTNYRKLAKLPAPVFKKFSTEEWLNHIRILMFEKLEEYRVNMEISIDRHIPTLLGDEKLLTQVMLNLIYNALDALTKKDHPKKIIINVGYNGQKQIQIMVANNGELIPSDIQEKVFIPFYTTKENGSGIGLSISRQIILAHKGYIYLESDENMTRFIIVL